MTRFIAILVMLGTVTEAGADQRDDALAGWDAMRKRIKIVRYTIVGAQDQKDMTGGKQPPPAGVAPRYQGVMMLDLPNRRHRFEEVMPRESLQDPTKFRSLTRVMTFGNDRFKTLLPRDKNETRAGHIDLHISRGDMRPVPLGSGKQALFLAHGFIPMSRDLPSPGRWPTPTDPEEFEVHGTGVLNGRPHTILRGEPWHGYRDEYWVDPTRGWAIGRFVIWVDNTDPYQKYDIQYQEVSGVRVLKGWTHTVSRHNRVVELNKMDVTKVEVEPATTDADFDIPVEPGYVTSEQVYPDKGSGLDPFRPAEKLSRPKSGGGREVIHQTGFTTATGEPVPLDPPWWTRWWVWAVAGAGVVVGLWWGARRTGRRGKAGPLEAKGG